MAAEPIWEDIRLCGKWDTGDVYLKPARHAAHFGIILRGTIKVRAEERDRLVVRQIKEVIKRSLKG